MTKEVKEKGGGGVEAVWGVLWWILSRRGGLEQVAYKATCKLLWMCMVGCLGCQVGG